MPTPPSVHPLVAAQSSFASLLLRGEAPSTPRGFDIYRNNVRTSLRAAIIARYPVITRLVGQEFAEAMALVFVGRHPPTSPVVAEYGAQFAAFLETFEPAAELPYLPDVARLEWQRQLAFHALDAPALPIGALAAIAPERLESIEITLHPAAFVLASAWPVVSIWTTNTVDDVTRPIDLDGNSEVALVTRPDLDVHVHRLPAHADAFVEALKQGRVLGDAIVGMPDGFDLPTVLAALFAAGAVTTIADRSSQ